MDNKDVIEKLKEQYEYHRTMMFKALGAIEVLGELQNKEKSDEKEEKDK